MFNVYSSNYFPLDITYKWARHPTEASNKLEERLRAKAEVLKKNIDLFTKFEKQAKGGDSD